jgi:uncharacterized damage-inducible protein DinB
MTSRVPTIRRLVRFDRLSFESFERSIRRLGWKAATANREIGHLTVKDTLVHILNVQEAWLVAAAQDRWEEVRGDQRRRRENVRSFADLTAYRKRAWASIDPLLRGLTDRQLDRRVSVPWIPGRYTLEDGFFQSSFEQAHHLGEVIAAYWQKDRVPPQMMWIPLQRGLRVSVR